VKGFSEGQRYVQAKSKARGGWRIDRAEERIKRCPLRSTEKKGGEARGAMKEGDELGEAVGDRETGLKPPAKGPSRQKKREGG